MLGRPGGLLGPVAQLVASLDPDALARFAAMTGTPDAAHKQYYRDFVVALKAAGVWNKIAAGWLTSDLDSQASRLNIKNPATFTLSPQNSPTHTSYRGFSGNGTNSYLKTGFIPSTSGAGIIALNDAHVAAFDLTERGVLAADLGIANSPTNRITGIRPRYTDGNSQFFVNGTVLLVPANSSQGTFVATRGASTLMSAYRDGVFARTEGTTTGVGVPATEMYLLALNNNGSPAVFSTDTISFYCLGSSLTEVEQRALSNAVWVWLNNVGAVAALPTLGVFDGNSLTAGAQATSIYTAYPNMASGALTTAGIKNVSLNKGIGGQPTPTMTANAPTNIDPLLISTNSTVHGKSFLVAWELLNDINLNSVTPQVAVDHMQTYCLARKAAGWGKVLVCNTLNHATIGGWTHNVSQSAVNAELASRWTNFADAMVDLASIVALQDNTNLTYWYSDGIHLIDAGYALVGSAVEASIASVL